MKASKYVVSFLTALFIGIVLIERVPGVLVPTQEQYEWLMFGLFKISLIDDITHGISGIVGLIALILGYKWRVYYLLLVGGYYSLDALFFLVNGIMTGQPLIDNILLNLPHIGITVLVGYALCSSLKRIELK